MYTTRPLSLYQNSPEAMKLLPEGPNSGYLVLQADVSTPTYFFGMFKSIETIKSWPIENLPFPQNKLLSISHGGGGPVAPVVDHVYMIPVISQPLSSNRYYVIKASGQHRGEAYASSKEEDIVTCCFCLPSITDEDPRPFDPDDVYQQFEFFVTDSSRNTYMPIAISLAPNGYPPEFLRS
ncbi:uncharacterized protein LOC110736769 [Chenopodium quinoa]|uniref:uncharacterized protein LOC110736769 n=1 Tax=Chenopodium quinoa TaxID=63459 RepID=UPI000B786E69|nr:uncharacterized protein LOC110736769 [Chenopodium quinoa]